MRCKNWFLFCLRVCVCAGVLGVGVLAVGPAAAQNMATAEALFNEGKRLFKEGQVALACAKFAESQRVDASPGTLMNLAACHEKEGKTASAWAEYLAANRAAKSAGRSELAEESAGRAALLEPNLARLRLTIGGEVAGLEVLRDGELVASGSFGTALPIDPGAHEVSASAPGYQNWTQRFDVAAAESQSVVIPALTPVAAQEAPATPAPQLGTSSPLVREERPSSPTAAYVVGGAGLAVTGAGLVFGALAQEKYSEAEKACPTRLGCDDEAMSARDDADSRATIANIAVPIGLAAVATGVVLYLVHSGSEKERSALSVDVLMTSRGATALVGGQF